MIIKKERNIQHTEKETVTIKEMNKNRNSF